MNPESDAFMRRLLLEREVPDQLKAHVEDVLSLGAIPQWVGSELIDQLNDLPKCKVTDSHHSRPVFHTVTISATI
jgi:hypothetical protein